MHAQCVFAGHDCPGNTACQAAAEESLTLTIQQVLDWATASKDQPNLPSPVEPPVGVIPAVDPHAHHLSKAVGNCARTWEQG